MKTADDVTELVLWNVDEASSPEIVLQRLRQYYSNARDEGQPGSYDFLQRNLQALDLTPEQAVLSCRPAGKSHRQGSVIAEVARADVADFFCSSSLHMQPRRGRRRGAGRWPQQGINCAPHTRQPRYVNIAVNKQRRRDSRGASDETVKALGVIGVSIVDLDARERLPTGSVLANGKRTRGAVYPARQLWETNVESVRRPPAPAMPS